MTRSRSTHPDARALITLLAVFWFEALGLIGFGSVAVGSVALGCWGDNVDNPGAVCDPLSFFHGGLAGIWLALLLVVGGSCLVWWTMTEGHTRLRAVGYLAFASLAAVGIGLAAVLGPPLTAALVAIWVGWPSVAFAAYGIRSFREPTTRTDQVHT